MTAQLRRAEFTVAARVGVMVDGDRVTFVGPRAQHIAAYNGVVSADHAMCDNLEARIELTKQELAAFIGEYQRVFGLGTVK